MKKKHNGFTLVELLVVISIIALLLAILMPSLSRARESAKTVVCSSRLQQTGLAFSLYASEYDNHVPPVVSTYPGENGDYKHWQKRLEPYMKGGRGGRTYEIVRCPSIKVEIDGSSTLSYGMNCLFDRDGYDPDGLKQPRKLLNVKSPGDVIFVSDSINKWKKTSPSQQVYHLYYGFILLPESFRDYLYPTNGEEDKRHSGKKFSNTLYIDGHVVTGDIPYSNVNIDPDGDSKAWHGR